MTTKRHARRRSRARVIGRRRRAQRRYNHVAKRRGRRYGSAAGTACQIGGGGVFPVFIGRSWQRGGGTFTPVTFSGQTFQRGGGATYPSIGAYRYGYIKRRQRGAGLGSFFKSLWRTVAPVIKPFASNTLKEIGRAGAQTALQYGSRLLDGETTIKESGLETLKDFGKQAGQIALKQARQQAGMGQLASRAAPLAGIRRKRRKRVKALKRVYKPKRSTVGRRRRRKTKSSRAKLFGY
jgi:hypothetical protein